MAKGTVSEDQRALVHVEIMDAEGRPHSMEVALDTGFAGYLALPGETIQQLGLASVGTRSFEPVEGRLMEFEAYLAEVSLGGRSTDAVVLRSDGPPRLGMTMLLGNRITMDAGDQGAVSIEPLEPVASRQISHRKVGLFGRLLGFAKRPFLGIAGGLVITVGIIVYAFGVFSLPLDFGEILTFMGIWLALGLLFGQTRPASMPLTKYLERRILGFACCYGLFVAILIVYAFHAHGTSERIKGEEIFGLVVLSVVSFAAGFLAGLDKEPNQS